MIKNRFKVKKNFFLKHFFEKLQIEAAHAQMTTFSFRFENGGQKFVG